MTKAIGSTTVCVATLQENMLKTALIGDSGYALYRRKEKYFELMFKSKEQQRSFNFPI